MTDQKITKQENASISLALQLDSGDRQLLGASPSVEELAAFYDQMLPENRRTEVLSHIANCPKTYKQWINFVELVSQDNEVVQEAPLDDQSDVEQGAVIQQVGKWFKANLSKSATFTGTGLAAAAALVLMVNVGTTPSEQIDGIYGEYATQWNTMPTMSLPKRSIGTSIGQIEKSPARDAIETGLLAGLAALGPKFIVSEFDQTALSQVKQSDSSLDKASFQTFYNAGRMTAISHFKCQIDASSHFYESSKEVTDKIVDELSKTRSSEGVFISESYQGLTDSKQYVCGFRDSVLQIVRAK